MSTLEISLVVLVVATLALVVVLNALQTRRTRGATRREPADRAAGGADPASDDSRDRREPLLGDPDALLAEGGSVGRTLSAPSIEAMPAVTSAPTPTAQAVLASEAPQAIAAAQVAAPPVPAGDAASRAPRQAVRPALDELADCIVELDLSAVASGALTPERLASLLQPIRRAGAKPIIVEADAFANGRWRALAAGEIPARLRLGVLLANRHGPLNAMEFSEFVGAVHGLAEQLGVLADTPEMPRVLERARDLDATCAQLDAQIGVNIEAREPLGVEDLARVAQLQGLVERGNNRYARLADDAATLFSLSLADVPNRMTLLLDVPRCPQALDPWPRLLECARACAQQLQGRIVDDAGRPLSEVATARISDQLAQRYRSLDGAGFPAGSPLALRLFN